MNAFIDWASLMPVLVDAMIFDFRVLAGVMSLMLFMDWHRQRGRQERPPYDRKRNQAAWNWAGAGMMTGAVSFVALDMNYRTVTGQSFADVFVLIVWWCWANAATVRMAARAERPRFIYYGASIFVIGGTSYSLLVGA